MNKLLDMEKIKKLNWWGFMIVFLLCIAAGFMNESCKTIQDSLFIGVIFGLPASIVILIVGREK